jgi:DinB superfamily
VALPPYALELHDIVIRTVPLLLAMDDERTSRRPFPGKWSPREIIGHLVDSASNNHQRFVRAAFQDDLVFVGYAQDDWVAVQKYQDAPWADLVTLWASFNQHLSRVMMAIPEAVRLKSHTRHNLDGLAFRPVSAESPTTLDYFMDDYVRHLQHHLKQIPGIL